VAGSLSEEAWIRVSAGAGSKGDRLYDWACLALPEPVPQTNPVGEGRWLLMRRSIEDPTEYAYYLAYGPAQTPVQELIRIAGRRWAIEDSFEAAKGKVGLDEYEVTQDGLGTITAQRSPECFGSSEAVLRGEICRKRSSGRGGRSTTAAP
jgi:hypothetical protein